MFRLNFLISFLLFWTTSKGQIVDTPMSIKLFKQGTAEMTIGFKKQFEKNAEYKRHYQIAITRYLQAYNLDSTIPELTTYLPNLYFDIQKFDSSLFWSYKLLRQDSINYVQGGSNNYLYLLENIGNCNLLLGDLGKSSYYLKLNYKFSKKEYERTIRVSNNAIDTTNLLCKLALSIDKSSDYRQLRSILIQKKVKTCDYAIEALRLFKELYYSKKIIDKTSIRQIDSKIVEMKKNCK